MQTDLSMTEKVKIYKYKRILQATDNFNPMNKIGEGGFGSVYMVNEKKIICLLFSFYQMLSSSSLTLWGTTIR